MKKITAMLLALLLLLGLCACGASSAASTAGDFAMEEAAEAPAEPAAGDGWDNYEEEAAVETEEDGTLNENANYSASLKIIKTGSLSIETETFEETDALIRSRVASYGGILADSSISGGTGYRYASYTVRIPSASFDDFYYEVAGGCTVTYQNVTAQDVTEQYSDLSTRLTTAEKKYERLLELLDKAETLTDIYSIDSEIADVEYEIDNLKGTLNGLDSRISFSTIYIDVSETSKVVAIPEDPTFGAQLLAALKNGTSGAVHFIENVILFLAETWFFWFVILVIVVLVIVFVQRGNKKRKAEQAKKEEEKRLKEEAYRLARAVKEQEDKKQEDKEEGK